MSIMIIIPARMASTRLPGKPLADIGGKPMIGHMIDIAQRSGMGPVLVAAGDQAIVDAVADVPVILTDPDLPSGSDRIEQALQASGATPEIVVNLQGDVPLLDPAALRHCVEILQVSDADIATLVVAVPRLDIADDTSSVKAVVDWKDQQLGKALYFSRAAVPFGQDPLYYHVGIYAYKRQSLAEFVAAPPHPLEEIEKLEQLRALGLGMHIAVGRTQEIPLGVDTAADLEKARQIVQRKTHEP